MGPQRAGARTHAEPRDNTARTSEPHGPNGGKDRNLKAAETRRCSQTETRVAARAGDSAANTLTAWARLRPRRRLCADQSRSQGHAGPESGSRRRQHPQPLPTESKAKPSTAARRFKGCAAGRKATDVTSLAWCPFEQTLWSTRSSLCLAPPPASIHVRCFPKSYLSV